MKILQVMKHWMGLIAGTLILTFGFSALIGILQEVMVHGDYDIRIFKFPLRNLEFIYEIFFFILMNFIFIAV